VAWLTVAALVGGCHHSPYMHEKLRLAKGIEGEIRADVDALAAIDPEPKGTAPAVGCMRDAVFVRRGRGEEAGRRQAEEIARDFFNTALQEEFYELVRPCIDYCGGVADNTSYAAVSRGYARKYHQRCLAEYQRYRELVAAASTEGTITEAKRLATEGDVVGVLRALKRLPEDSPVATELWAAHRAELDKAKAYLADPEVIRRQRRYETLGDELYALLDRPLPRSVEDDRRIAFLDAEREDLQRQLGALRARYDLTVAR
jgi:hypothetical protein